jgi:TolB-like protein/Tfp pilus assembly protein PilF
MRRTIVIRRSALWTQLVTAGKFSFGEFQLDTAADELRHGRNTVELQRIPRELLLMLVRRPGEVVTRSEILLKIWGVNACIDIETSINTAIRKIRRALRDDAERPSFIQTIPARGYRFIATVEHFEVPDTAQTSSHRPRMALAVLPFDTDGDLGNEYFADGLTEEAITALGRIAPEQLAVVARTSSSRYKHTAKGVGEIGQELGVDYLLESTVRRENRQVRVTCRLIRVADQLQVWSATFDREGDSLLGMQVDIAVAVAEQIRVRLSAQRLAGLERSGTRDSDAYDLYLRGRFCMYQATPAAGGKALEYFGRAATLDPTYALAYAGIADTYSILPVNSDAAPLECWRRGLEAAERAVELDEDLAEAHAALSWVKFWLDWDWAGAEQSARRAIELDSNVAWAHFGLATVLSHTGRHEEAAAAMDRVLSLDPVSPLAHAIAGQYSYQARAYDEALQRLRHALAIDAEFWISHIVIGKVYEVLGRPLAALDAFQQALAYSSGNTEALSLKGHTLASSGREIEAREVMAALEQIATRKFVPPYNIALIAAGLGHDQLCFEWLDRAYQSRDVHMVFLPVDPKWDAIRDDQRFLELLRRCGIPMAG